METLRHTAVDDSILTLVERVHASPSRAVVVLAGAGSQALAWLLGVPGASRTLLEAVVPYGQRAMFEFLGHEPDQYVSIGTAGEMAEAAYWRALHLSDSGRPVAGVACTASISTDRPKRGEHRCCVAVHADGGVTAYDLNLSKGARDRPGEEDVVSRLVLNALAHVCDVESSLNLGLLDSERLEVQHTEHSDLLRELLAARNGVLTEGKEESIAPSTVTVYPDGRMVANEAFDGGLMPGSFSPLHQGHERLAEVASELLGSKVVFEISVVNVDKPPLKEAEVRRRLPQFRGKGTAVLTCAKTFPEKAALFPGCTFVIGWDTAVRLVHQRYYGDSHGVMVAALSEMRVLGCKFLVAGRLQDGVFHTLDEVAIPDAFADMFEAIPESRFREDISSTQFRSAGAR